MPIYEYQCEKCTKLVEQLRKMSDESPVECLECNLPMTKLISTAEFRFRGRDWPATTVHADRKRISTKDN